MVGIKGQGTKEKHRAWTYQEKKLNKMGKEAFIRGLFLPDYDLDRIKYATLKIQETKRPNIQPEIISTVDAKMIRLILEEEDRKSFPKETEIIVDMAFDFKRKLENTAETLEALAIVFNIYQHLNWAKESGRERFTDKTLRDAWHYATDLWKTDWNTCMAILETLRE